LNIKGANNVAAFMLFCPLLGIRVSIQERKLD